MTWAQRLKLVFIIDIEACSQSADTVKVIACIEDPVVIKKILSHLNEKSASTAIGLLTASRPHHPFTDWVDSKQLTASSLPTSLSGFRKGNSSRQRSSRRDKMYSISLPEKAVMKECRRDSGPVFNLLQALETGVMVDCSG